MRSRAVRCGGCCLRFVCQSMRVIVGSAFGAFGALFFNLHTAPRPKGCEHKKNSIFLDFFLHFSRFFCVIFNENLIENCKNNMP